jgi:chromosome segregation ATPase
MKSKSFMKNNLNFGLLILILAIVLSFVAATVYYQTTFRTLNIDSKTKLSELQKVTSTLLEKKAELAETAAKEQSLTEKYTGIKSEKDELEDERDSLEDQLAAKSNELVQTKEDLRDAQALADSYKSDYENAIDDIKELGSDKDDVCDALTALGGSSGHCD